MTSDIDEELKHEMIGRCQMNGRSKGSLTKKAKYTKII
jgi:hypothetical protein